MVRLTERLKIVSKLNIIFFLQCTGKKHHFTLFTMVRNCFLADQDFKFYLSWNETELRIDEAQQSKSMGRSVSLEQRSNFIKVSFLYLLKILMYYHNSFFNSSGSTPYRATSTSIETPEDAKGRDCIIFVCWLWIWIIIKIWIMGIVLSEALQRGASGVLKFFFCLAIKKNFYYAFIYCVQFFYFWLYAHNMFRNRFWVYCIEWFIFEKCWNKFKNWKKKWKH